MPLVGVPAAQGQRWEIPNLRNASGGAASLHQGLWGHTRPGGHPAGPRGRENTRGGWAWGRPGPLMGSHVVSLRCPHPPAPTPARFSLSRIDRSQEDPGPKPLGPLWPSGRPDHSCPPIHWAQKPSRWCRVCLYAVVCVGGRRSRAPTHTRNLDSTGCAGRRAQCKAGIRRGSEAWQRASQVRFEPQEGAPAHSQLCREAPTPPTDCPGRPLPPADPRPHCPGRCGSFAS